MRRAARRDAIEPAVIQALEQVGITCVRVSDPGLPDLICAARGEIRLVELKSGKAGKLTKAQIEMHQRLPICTVRSVGEALALFGVSG